MSVERRRAVSATIVAGLCIAHSAWAWDPLVTDGLVSATPAVDMLASGEGVCAFGDLPGPLRLQDAIERALCDHPEARQAWANVKSQAAGVGMRRAAFLPTIDARWQGTHDVANQNVTGYPHYGSSYRTWLQNSSVSLGWVLYDFGGRSAALRSATALWMAAQANQTATLQNVFAVVARDFYSAQAAQGAWFAAQEMERLAQRSAEAATARVERGAAAISDQLQAQTAHAESIVNRTRAQSEWLSRAGALASDMNLSPATPITLPDVDDVRPDHEFDDSVSALIEDALHQHPGIVAAEAQLAAARAVAAQVRAEGLPRVGLVARYQFNNQPTHLQLGLPAFPATRSEWYVGLELTVPIFEGFVRTYQVRQANAQMELKEAAVAEARQKIGLDVWKRYQMLQSATKNLAHSMHLRALAEASHEAAQGRYQIGVGSMLELLSAQSALARAKQQRIQALTDWQAERLRLASSLGRLGVRHLQGHGGREP